MGLVVDLGCGRWPRPDATVRVDFNDYPHVDVKHDLLKVPYPFDDNSAEKIYLWDVAEHIPIFEVVRVFYQCYKILQPGGMLDITVPDVEWIAERIIKKDWKEKAKEPWMNRFKTPFECAMSYLFGGFYHPSEHKHPGMGHVAGYDEQTLISSLSNLMLPDMAIIKWGSIKRVPDPRNECILRIQAVK